MSRDVRARAILFDLDGVLVDSRRCIERVWQVWAARRGLDPGRFISLAPGRRTSETLRLVTPHLDAAAETALLDALEEVEEEGLVATPGAERLLSSLPAGRWGIVTSGSRAVATLRLVRSRLPVPDVLVTGEQVERGKPHPAPYRLGAAGLHLDPADCIAIEDAPPGIESARAAGMQVVAVATTHAPEQLTAADVRVDNLDALTVSVANGRLVLQY